MVHLWNDDDKVNQELRR